MHFESEIVANRSVEYVWNFFDDPSSLAKWDRSVAQVIPTFSGPVGVGYTFDTIASSKAGLRMSYRVIEYVPNHHSRVLLTDSPMFKDAIWSFVFEPVSVGTRIICQIDFSLWFRYWFLIPILLVTNQGALQRDLQYLKQTLESIPV